MKMNGQLPLQGVLVVSDVDNTLLSPTEGMPPENIEAIRRFCELGGCFTVATGRNIPSTRYYLSQFVINAPVILLNGGLVYDYAMGEVLDAQYISREKTLPIVQQLLEHFPGLDMEIMTEDLETYIVRNGPAAQRHLEHEHFTAVSAAADKVPGHWFKVLMAGSAEDCQAAEKYCRKMFGRERSLLFQRTQACYFEILPAHSTKGTALRVLQKHLNVRPEDTYAMGDYDNDVALLRAAGTGVAVANAPWRVRRSADLVTDRCMDCGAARFLNALIASRTDR